MNFIAKFIILSFFIVSQISLLGCAVKYAKLPESSLTSAIQKPGSVEAAVRESVKKASENKGLNAFIYIDENAAIKAAVASDIRRKSGKLACFLCN